SVPPPPEHPSTAAVRRALRSSLFLGGLLLMALPSLLWGVLSTLAPLQLADFGWGAAAIGAVWLVGAAFETALSPLAGRMVDRRGVLVPVRLALAVGAVVSVGLAVGPRPLLYVPLLVVASGAYGVLFLGEDDVADHLLDPLGRERDRHRPEIDDRAEDRHRDHVPPEREDRVRHRAEVAEVDDRAHPEEVDRQPARGPEVELRRLRVQVKDARHGKDHVADEDRDAEPPDGVPARP